MISIFSCPLCGSDLSQTASILACQQGHQYPQINGQLYFLPLYQNDSWTVEQIEALQNQLANSTFLQYMQLKKRRQIIEPYAAFQPFNESFQALLNSIDALKNYLKPGDVILDTWCRTGWSGDFLANLFPEQSVISIWEGDNSVLGYKGYQALFTPQARATNHTVIFHEPNKRLPLKDQSVAFCFAYDSLHRYRGIIDEAYRVTKRDGIINFAHVHLANAEPVPFFERGGEYRYGLDYQQQFESHQHNDGRKVNVLSELDVYSTEQYTEMSTTPDTEHYNGYIWIAQQQHCYLTSAFIDIQASNAVFFNPLMAVDDSGRLSINRNNDNNRHMLERHPFLNRAYEAVSAIPESIVAKLPLFKQFTSIEQLQRAQLSTAQIESLIKHKVLFSAPLSNAMLAAQAMHMNAELPAAKLT
ncbi:class I SAM-dependent methyltransferase [Shewanella sp. Scap07]|uniref:hypothetical protein n=1 Tax=Shewanella sp. Scap07 TaxID=2589987 RepID=UPI0015BF4CA8|nr:hypothetical protein [Shewanella sp. Scap07]QLE84725.1 class I SAM-dependent methyltransferase [Shewanella sp. Scap07]